MEPTIKRPQNFVTLAKESARLVSHSSLPSESTSIGLHSTQNQKGNKTLVQVLCISKQSPLFLRLVDYLGLKFLDEQET